MANCLYDLKDNTQESVSEAFKSYYRQRYSVKVVHYPPMIDLQLHLAHPYKLHPSLSFVKARQGTVRKQSFVLQVSFRADIDGETRPIRFPQLHAQVVSPGQDEKIFCVPTPGYIFTHGSVPRHRSGPPSTAIEEISIGARSQEQGQEARRMKREFASTSSVKVRRIKNINRSFLRLLRWVRGKRTTAFLVPPSFIKSFRSVPWKILLVLKPSSNDFLKLRLTGM